MAFKAVVAVKEILPKVFDDIIYYCSKNTYIETGTNVSGYDGIHFWRVLNDKLNSVVSNFEPLDARSFPLGKVCVRAPSKFEIVIFCALVLA